ncbi:MAG: imelysin family protein [Polyangiaceae bacterium]
MKTTFNIDHNSPDVLMTRPCFSSDSPRLAWLAPAALALTVHAAGCERVSYYSFTGTAPDDGETSTDPTTSTTSTGTQTGTLEVTRAAVLEGIGVCAARLYDDVAVAAEAFSEATAAGAGASDAESLSAAREAWIALMDAWQRAELVRAGPAAPSTSPGGEGLRDFVYSWPLVSRCLVEQKLAAKSYASSDFLTTALVSMRGLAAAEYLLFYEGTDNVQRFVVDQRRRDVGGAHPRSCRPEARTRRSSPPMSPRRRRRSRTRGRRTGRSGGPPRRRRTGRLPLRDRPARHERRERRALYLVTDVKDGKLGKPLGLLDCESATCPQAVESPHARRSRAHLKNNLLGFRRVLEGCEEGGDLGFDDLLVGLGKRPSQRKMSAHVDEAIAAADLPSDDVAVALVVDEPKVTALHAAVKKITDDLKTEFVTVLDLELPQTVEGDND